jgi:hypothetical protein
MRPRSPRSRSQLARVDLPDGRVAVWQAVPARIPAGPAPATHWPVALDTGGYEHAPARMTLQVKKPPARRAPGQPARHQGHDSGRHRPADQPGITRFPAHA